MFKYALTAVLFAAPLYAAAYDYDALPKQAAPKEAPITYEQAYPDLRGKSYLEIEDIDAKLDRLATQAKYKRQQEEKAKAEAEAKAKAASEEEEAPAKPQETPTSTDTVRYTPHEDIDVKLDKANKHRGVAAPSSEPVREIWHADPATGTHDWVAAPVGGLPQDEFPQNADSDEFPQETPADEFPQDEFPQK